MPNRLVGFVLVLVNLEKMKIDHFIASLKDEMYMQGVYNAILMVMFIWLGLEIYNKVIMR